MTKVNNAHIFIFIVVTNAAIGNFNKLCRQDYTVILPQLLIWIKVSMCACIHFVNGTTKQKSFLVNMTKRIIKVYTNLFNYQTNISKQTQTDCTAGCLANWGGSGGCGGGGGGGGIGARIALFNGPVAAGAVVVVVAAVPFAELPEVLVLLM